MILNSLIAITIIIIKVSLKKTFSCFLLFYSVGHITKISDAYRRFSSSPLCLFCSCVRLCLFMLCVLLRPLAVSFCQTRGAAMLFKKGKERSRNR
ncbi:hypothetical protein ABB37_06724 [Leptomonas pyrrhocoris]|uniref:Uncharacterized protein n=1 Tax=Leptomonas pyrrhocoris TaxID=157538 RepID=A0A0N0DU29_LEPPY|nr:hypothetical protein ABB37_06724 [Leptomonas pyrrhocoris]KPA77954.1 hypothetical protein ABB37_06724 [Leptomonas pyrrhocoris]|eukprot:XP_015656393.1 hypothetical protein ABB37_06724 [Leptomonas pyrrhocoris]